MAAATLYEITGELSELERWLEEVQGDVTGEDDRLDRYFEAVENLEEKVDNYCALIAELEAKAEARKREAKRLSDLASFDENKARRLKDRLYDALIELDVDRVDGPRFRATIAKNGGRVPVEMDAVDADELPERFRRVRTSVDKSAVRDALEAGEELKFARLGERGSHLRIK